MSVPFQRLPGISAVSGLFFAQGASAPIARKANLTATVAPVVTDDANSGYGDWSVWINTTGNRAYVCVDATAGAAVWREITPDGESLRQTIVTSNSFSAKQAIRKTAGGYVTSQADVSTNAEVAGVIESATGSAFTAVFEGFARITGHGFTIGDTLYLSSSTPGALVNTAPSAVGTVIKRVAVVWDANTLIVLPSMGQTNSAMSVGEYAQDTGTANNYVIAPSPAVSAYAAGVKVSFKAANTNTAASTINVNSLGAVTIKKQGSQDLQAGDINVGRIYTLFHDGTNFQLMTPIFQPVSTTANFGYFAPDNASGEPTMRLMVTRDIPETARHDAQQYNTTSGTSTAYTLNLTPGPTSYFSGMTIKGLAHAANGAGPVTINVNSLGAKTIKKNVSADLAASDILNGQVFELVYDGVNFQYSFPQVANPQIQSQIFTSNGNFTVPSGITKIKVTNVGAGAGGGAGSGASGLGSGGGAGSTSVKNLSVTPAQVIAVTVGTAGTAGTAAGANPTDGTDTTFGVLLTGKGGIKGINGTNAASVAGGVGGATQSADYSVAGESGAPSLCLTSQTLGSGRGGSSLYGLGGGAIAAAGVGKTGTGYGSGGGGAMGNNNGGAGAPGICIVEWVG